jgi:DNA polymerase
MTAFVRFRSMPSVDPADEDEHFIAWYEPQHHVLRRASGFFIDRFASMRFSILTPDLTLHWDRTEARFAPGLRREDAVSVDAVEEWWCRYYASIFNPARINAPLMRSHMPRRFWHNLPEAAVVLDLIEQARSRTSRMIHSSIPSNQDAP